MPDVSNCQVCGTVISEVITRSTIPGVHEFIGGMQVCSRCFDKERGTDD